jgi:deazaflavin-dependent oxidoreductase (nitroreductase family)
MPLPGWLARFNRRVTNPALRPVAGSLPYFGVVHHRGRGTGRVHRTPVNVFPHGSRFVIALTYGADVDWVKNVLAAGGCRLVHRGRTVDLVGPTIRPLRDEAPAIPAPIRTLLRALGVDEVLLLERVPEAPSQTRRYIS